MHAACPSFIVNGDVIPESEKVEYFRIAGADIAFFDNFNFLGIIINKLD